MSAVDLNGPDLKPVEKQKLKDLIWEFRGLFAYEGSSLGRTTVVKHSIKTRGTPIREHL